MSGAAATGLALPIGRYRAWFSSSRPVRFSEFPGSAWRGGFGYALKKAACATREPRCAACLLYRSCAYPYIFETPPPPGAAKMRRYTSVPHPFVFDHCALPGRDTHGCLLEFSLFGEANRHLPIIVYALMSAVAAEQGIAGNRLSLERLEREAGLGSEAWAPLDLPDGLAGLAAPAWAEPPAPRAALALRIETPLRLKREGRHVGPERFCFADLFGNLLRRISMLTYFHTETPLETDFRGLSEAARAIQGEFELEWKEQRRYSQRQGEVMRLGGVVGRIALGADGADLAPFWPYLWLGQWTHAGTGATMGLGRYRIVG